MDSGVIGLSGRNALAYQMVQDLNQGQDYVTVQLQVMVARNAWAMKPKLRPVFLITVQVYIHYMVSVHSFSSQFV